MTIQTKYDLGDIVYLKTDPDQYERVVTSIMIRPGVSYTYYLGFGATDSPHFELEICAQKDLMKELNISKTEKRK